MRKGQEEKQKKTCCLEIDAFVLLYASLYAVLWY